MCCLYAAYNLCPSRLYIFATITNVTIYNDIALLDRY